MKFLEATLVVATLSMALGAGRLAVAEDALTPARVADCDSHARPSKLDYLVIATIGDSPSLLSMPGLYSARADRGEPTVDRVGSTEKK